MEGGLTSTQATAAKALVKFLNASGCVQIERGRWRRGEYYNHCTCFIVHSNVHSNYSILILALNHIHHRHLQKQSNT